MIDDDDAVVIAERTGKADDAIRRNTDGRSASGRQPEPARPNAALIDRAEPFHDRRAHRQRVSERRSRHRGRSREGTRRRRLFSRELCRELVRRAVARLVPAELANPLASGNRDVFDAQCFPAGRERSIDRAMLQRGKLLPFRGELLAAADQLGAGGKRRRFEPLLVDKLRRQALRTAANDRKRRIQKNADPNELVRAACVRQGEQRRPARHDGETGEKGGDRSLLLGEASALPNDVSGGKPILRIGRCNARLRGLDGLCGRGLLRLQPLRFAAGMTRSLLQPGRFSLGSGLLAARLLQLLLERRGLRGSGRTGCNHRRQEQGKGDQPHDLTFAMIRMVRKDGRRAEQLLGKHRPDEEVGPGCRPEGEQQISAGAL